MSEEQNIVYIGRKPVMSYVLAIITHFNMPGAKDVVLKARGMSITTAVDVAEVTRRRFITTLAVENISIGTEEMTGDEGRTRAVSFIEITLSREGAVTENPKAEPSQSPLKEGS